MKGEHDRKQNLDCRAMTNTLYDALFADKRESDATVLILKDRTLLSLSLIHISEPTNQRGSRMPSSA